MSDTVKIERPLRCRRHEDLGGRVKQDLLGNAIKVKTRTQDSQDALSSSWPDSETAQQPARLLAGI